MSEEIVNEGVQFDPNHTALPEEQPRRRPRIPKGEISGIGKRKHTAVRGGADIKPNAAPVRPPHRPPFSIKEREFCNIVLILFLMCISVMSMSKPGTTPPIGGGRLLGCIFCITFVFPTYIYKIAKDYNLDSAFLFSYKNSPNFYEKSVSHVLGLIFISLSVATAIVSLTSSHKNLVYLCSIATTVSSFLYAASQTIHSEKEHGAVSSMDVEGETAPSMVYRMMRPVAAYPPRGRLNLLENDPELPPYLLL